ncbi:uncharacterized protein LOC118187192 [Stegodyphus dumicola]|uniref:uncharacterized protein LOC118187192 n=1 Tax=Stegodyphus dumicola TaxID=202533 RepID=UPI0015A867CC|nr:uncharacterized protein LOC118187192 [Stegodyphus dumicola]
MVGMEEAPSLKETLGLDHYYADETEDEIKTELGRKLKEYLEELLQKIKDAIDHGKTVREDLMDKLRELREKMKELRVKVGDKAKDLMEKLKEKARDFVRELLDKLGLEKSKRSEEEIEAALADFNIKDIFKRLRDYLLKDVNKEELKAKVEKIFGKGSEMGDALLELINKKGEKYKQKLLDLVDRFLGKKEERALAHRSLQDYWEKIKEYFKDLHITLKEKYMKFGEWVKNAIDKGLAKSKDKLENIKSIAREFIDHAKGVSKEVAEEALDFMRPYKDDLGSLWEQLKETVKDIVNKKD